MQHLFFMSLVLNQLSQVKRVGGTLFAGIPTHQSESIAEHSYKVVWLTLLFSQASTKYSINLANLLTAAITHDWSESVLGDLPTKSQSYSSYFPQGHSKYVSQAHDSVNQSIITYLSTDIDTSSLSTRLTETESSILSAADTTALLLEILEWKYSGMQLAWLDKVFSNTLTRLEQTLTSIPELQPLISIITEAYQLGSKPAHPFLTLDKFQTNHV